jgi:tetratricopeptide (TPR) repeat protein
LNDARERLGRALGIAQAAPSFDKPALAEIETMRGFLARVEKRYPDALAAYQHALDLREQALGPNHPGAASALLGKGRVLLAMRAPERALEPLEKALVVSKESAPELLEVRLALALALMESGRDRSRGRDLAKEATDALARDPALERSVEDLLPAVRAAL